MAVLRSFSVEEAPVEAMLRCGEKILKLAWT
jgi:hypothetical protein